MKRGLSLLLALLFLLACLAACGGNSNGGKTPSGEQEKLIDDEDRLALPEANYTGKTYTVIYRDDAKFVEEWSPNANARGDVINDAITSRNQAVTDLYGVKLDFESARMPGDQILDRVHATVDDDYYQLVAAKTYDLAADSVRGYYLNWLNSEQVPVVNLDADWWAGDFTRAARYNNCSYIATGPLSLTDMYFSSCIYFNKDMLNKYMGSANATNDLFALVESGEWTLAKLQEYAAQCTEGTENAEDDSDKIYGFATESNTSIDAFIYASNLQITERTATGIALKKVDANNRILELYSTLSSFLARGNATTNTNQPVSMVGKFVQSKAVFSTGILSSAKDIQNYAPKIQYGVLPYPKLDANQAEYHTYKVDNKTGFCIPRSVKENNREFVGTITEALAYYSNKYVKPALYDKVLRHKNVQDEQSSKCVDLILAGELHEFSNIYARAWGDMQSPAHLLRTCLKNNTDYVEAFGSKKSFFEKKLTNFLAQFKSDDVGADE